MDDLLLFGPDLGEIQKLQNESSSRFHMTDLGELSHYLGMEITMKKGSITLKQRTYMRKILTYFGMIDCNPVSTPMESGIANSLIPVDKEADPLTIKWYQQVIGSLMWPAVHTRPDLAYSVGVLSRYAHTPSQNLLQFSETGAPLCGRGHGRWFNLSKRWP